jgi:hypothetical protein
MVSRGPLVSPSQELGVQVVDIAEGSRCEEAIAQEADLPLDAPLLVAAYHRTGPRQEVVVAGQLGRCEMVRNSLAMIAALALSVASC